jgi:hypothetical protein
MMRVKRLMKMRCRLAKIKGMPQEISRFWRILKSRI